MEVLKMEMTKDIYILLHPARKSQNVLSSVSLTRTC